MSVTISMAELLKKALNKASSMGIEVTRQGSLILNEQTAFKLVSKLLEELGVIYLSIKEAVKEYPDLVEKYGLKKVKIDLREVDNGVFIYVPKNTKLTDPVYNCFVLASKGFVQRVYNLIVVDDGSEAVSVTGCLSLVHEAIHSSHEEAYVGKGSKYYKIMIHNWLPKVVVSAIKRVTLMSEANYYDYYINSTSLDRMSFITEVFHEGEKSSSKIDQVVIGSEESKLRYITTTYLSAPGSNTEIVSRVLGMDESYIETKSSIMAVKPGVKGHVECRGLLISDRATITTIPILKSSISDSTLTHEASIGRIKRDEVEYLMARGFSEDEAVSLIIRGFLETGLDKVPEKMKPIISVALDKLSSAKM
ncbi:MAG: SufD family Fe-S cluster assembly protein [Desulfurococcaceae archaeon]